MTHTRIMHESSLHERALHVSAYEEKKARRIIFHKLAWVICPMMIIIFLTVLYQSVFHKDYSGICINNAKEISEGIRNAMLHRSYSAEVSFEAYTLKRDELKSIADSLVSGALYESNDPKGGDYIKYQYGGYELRHRADKGLLKYEYSIKIIPKYYTTADEENWVDNKIKNIISGNDHLNGMSDYEKTEWVHDYICSEVNYDTVHKHTPGSGHIQSTAYGALYYHTALCQGYAVLCYRLLKELGIDVRIVTGKARVSDSRSAVWEKHAWNIVELDGRYYNLDVTFDDISGTRDYFMKTEEEFGKDHMRVLNSYD